MDIEKSIMDNFLREKEDIKNFFPKTIGEIKNEIIKAKKAEIGTISTHGGVKMRKEANGWVPVKGEKSTPKGEDQPAEKTGEPADLGEHAKSASEAALQNAIKNSPDSEVRAAAHKELERRGKEEKTEMFSKPEPKKEDQSSDFTVGDTVKISAGIQSDPAGMKGQTVEVTKIDGDILHVKNSEGKTGMYMDDTASKVEVASKSVGVGASGEDTFLTSENNEKNPNDNKETKEQAAERTQRELDKLDKEEKSPKSEPKKEEPVKEDKKPDKKEETRKFEKELDYGNIKEWVGDVADDKSIDLIYDTLGGYDLNLMVKKTGSSPQSFSNAVYSKIDDIMDEVRDGEWPSKLKNSEVRDILWGMIMSESTRLKKSIYEDITEKHSTYQFLEGQSNLLQKSHINEFILSDSFSVSKTGIELKQRFEEQLKLELEEIRENSRKASELLTEIGSVPECSFEDEYYYMIDGYEDKIQSLPMVFKRDKDSTDLGESKWEYNSFARKIVDGMIEVLHLNTLLNTIVDGKQYKLTLKQASILGY